MLNTASKSVRPSCSSPLKGALRCRHHTDRAVRTAAAPATHAPAPGMDTMNGVGCWSLPVRPTSVPSASGATRQPLIASLAICAHTSSERHQLPLSGTSRHAGIQELPRTQAHRMARAAGATQHAQPRHAARLHGARTVCAAPPQRGRPPTCAFSQASLLPSMRRSSMLPSAASTASRSSASIAPNANLMLGALPPDTGVR